MNDKIHEKIEKFIKFIEILICIIILFTVLMGIPSLVKYSLNMIKSNDLKFTYEVFNEFLKHALLLIVGIELLEMIITKSHESILTLILFVIARKMLVYSAGLVDILIGSISISMLFLIIKFVVKDEKLMATLDNTFQASMKVEKINREYHLNIPTDMSNTLGGLVYELAKLEGVDHIVLNSRFVYGNFIFRVVSMKDEVITRIRIKENK